jgi:hypothetical protein
MTKPLIDKMINTTHGGLTVTRRADKSVSNQAFFDCECRCGALVTVSHNYLLRSKFASCGCVNNRKIR